MLEGNVMDARKCESAQKVVATMAISDMQLSEEFINQLVEVDEGKKSSEELRQKVIQKYANFGSENISLDSIEEKLGFTLKEYNAKVGVGTESHEQDNLPNPFDKLSMDELLFLREHPYFLK